MVLSADNVGKQGLSLLTPVLAYPRSDLGVLVKWWLTPFLDPISLTSGF